MEYMNTNRALKSEAIHRADYDKQKNTEAAVSTQKGRELQDSE